MKCRGNGLSLIKDFLNEPNPDIKELIDRGTLIKIGSEKVPRKKRSHDDDDDGDSELVDVFIYKHITDDNVEAVVDGQYDLIGPQKDSLLDFLKNANVTIKQLIDVGAFKLLTIGKVKIAKDPDAKDEVPPPAKKIKLENLSPAQVLIST